MSVSAKKLFDLLVAVEGLEKEPGSTAIINNLDVSEAEDLGLVERGSEGEIGLTHTGRTRLARLRLNAKAKAFELL